MIMLQAADFFADEVSLEKCDAAFMENLMPSGEEGVDGEWLTVRLTCCVFSFQGFSVLLHCLWHEAISGFSTQMTPSHSLFHPSSAHV
jgi:hypothetical protein